MSRRARAIIDVGAIERNALNLRDRLAVATQLCAVVKANGYGHGAIEATRAALAGGATWLAVATAGEAAALRQEAVQEPILILGPLDQDDLDLAIQANADMVAWTPNFVRRVSAAGTLRESRLHIKIDTGMGRWGVREPSAAYELAALIDETSLARLTGVMTHFATADEPEETFFSRQLSKFNLIAGELRRSHPSVMLHAANSAATLRYPDSHFDMVRCGVALYGLDPCQQNPQTWQLEPALELHSYVAEVTCIERGESVGYGCAFRAKASTYIATVPIGYADGVRRTFDRSVEVLVAGRRRPLAGKVSMDCLAVDLGPDTDIRVGEEVVLIGTSGSERILVEEVAKRNDTINYEIVCALSDRVERSYLRREAAPKANSD
jgi:alanine racemase